MAPQLTKAGSVKLPSLGDGFRALKRSKSYETLNQNTPSSSTGDANTDVLSANRNNVKTTSRHDQRQSASEDGTSASANPPTFLIGSSVEDDVFTHESTESAPSTILDEGTQLQVFDTSAARVDAQGIYPGTACMFVANLSQPYEDEALELEVTRAFSQFGEVWVKIKRDGHQMPFAFCQFTKDEHAQNAEKFGKGMMILGRPCRTEMARAHSSFVVYKKSGEPISLAEATTLLGQLGQVAKAEYVQEDVQACLGTSNAVLVTYKMYDNRREPVRYFAQNSNFGVIANDPKRFPNASLMASSGPLWNSDTDLMEQYDKDRRSAFVGNLPLSMTEEVLQAIAGDVGEVVSVNLYKKLIPGLHGERNCFAFVEFRRPGAADDLIRSMNGSVIEGFHIRVERKQSRTFTTPQRGPGHLRHVRSTIPKHRAAGFMELEHSSMDILTSPTRTFRDSAHLLAPGPKSFSQGRGRRPRSAIFGADATIRRAKSSFNLNEERFSPRGVNDAQSMADARLLNKKSVEFQLPTRQQQDELAKAEAATMQTSDVKSSPQTPKGGPVSVNTTPEKKCHEPQNVGEGHVPMAPMSWVMPPYHQYGYHQYTPMPMTPQGPQFVPMTPQGPQLVYPNYMGHQCYGGPLYDVFGNMHLSPSAMSPHVPNAFDQGNESDQPQGTRDHNG